MSESNETDAALIEQVRSLIALNDRVKQPWTRDKLVNFVIAALPKLLDLAEKGLGPESQPKPEKASEPAGGDGTTG